MRKITLLLVFALLAVFSYGQKQAQITITKLSEEAGKIYINYDISQSMPEESFDVKVIATHTNGTPITATTLSGDIGENIQGGENKQIVWSYEQDSIYLDETINIQLSANKIINTNYYSTPKLLIASTILPGKGVYMLDKTQNYLNWTYAGYGLIGTFALFRGISSIYYNKYTKAQILDDRNKFYTICKINSTIAGAAAISAIVVWGWNYARIFITKNSIMKKQNSLSNWQLYPSYNTFTNSNMLTLSFKF